MRHHRTEPTDSLATLTHAPTPLRSLIASSPPVLRVEGFAHGFPEEGEAERDDDDRDGRVVGEPGGEAEEALPLAAEHDAPLGAVVVLVAEAQEGQRGG